MRFLFLIASFFILEVYTFKYAWSVLGGANTFFAFLVATILGLGILRNQGRHMLSRIQQSLARGQAPADEVLRGILTFLAGILLLMPGFVSDLAALVLILPGTRQLMAAIFKRQLAEQMRRGSVHVFSSFGGAASYRGPAPDRDTRDVSPKVIDVTPISVKSRPADNSENDSDR